MGSKQTWKYEVFLSFRGEDTRKTFVGHLYYALKQKGIHTFKDDAQLERGKSISPELVKAIQQSRIAVVVFSKNYASSTWCLEELAKIMECEKELGQTVMPIFYHVDPSDVRKQSGCFADSFARHEENLQDYAEKWRDAFSEAGKRSGYDLLNGYGGDESDCIQHVVKDIFGRLCQASSTIHKDLVGIESRLCEVSSLLKMETLDVRFIGIWGMGGVGKTTIASAVLGKYSSQFEGVCFLDNVAEMQRTHGLHYLQGVLLSKILNVSLTITSVYEGMEIIKKRLCSTKVLLILDDVNQINQLEMLAGGHNWFGNGSRILITTRDKHLLDDHNVDEVYTVKLLPVNEAIELFSWHAFKHKVPEKHFKELSDQVVQYAGLLPLALKVLGSFLYGLDKIEWRRTIKRLKDMPNHEVLAKLKISLDGVSCSDQRLFLDIACLFRGQLKSYVEEILETCHVGSTIGIKVLIEKSLIFISQYDTIEMHDLIQEMAWHIVCQDDSRRSRVWLPKDIDDVFNGNLEAEAVEILWIPRNYIAKKDTPYYNKSEAFKRMKRLRVLIVRATSFCSSDSITYLPSSLRLLVWERYPINSLPECFEPLKLLGLDILESTRLQKLWFISTDMDKLKTLRLSHCEHLEELPSFEMMPNLERVKLEGCSSLRSISPSLVVLKKLISVELTDCQSLEMLPSCMDMESLETLKLSGLPKLKELPETNGMHHLSSLEISHCPSLEMPPSCVQIESLETLKLSGLPKLRKLPETSGVHNLFSLEISDCQNLEMLPSSVQMESLKVLKLSGLPKLGELPEIDGMHHLSLLEICDCRNLEMLPSCIKIESVETLKLCCLPNLRKFPETNQDMRLLLALVTQHSQTIELPSSIRSCSTLKQLKLGDCEHLVGIPDIILSEDSKSSCDLQLHKT